MITACPVSWYPDMAVSEDNPLEKKVDDVSLHLRCHLGHTVSFGLKFPLSVFEGILGI